MKKPAIPANEEERLNALYSYKVLDTLPEESYNEIVEMASQVCDVPVSLISLVDKDRCWFKAKLGWEQSEAPRADTYAAHAINQPGQIMVVEDALQDERFCDCPFVLGDPPQRFYTGTPLVNEEGFVLGTLCVIDHVPRKLSEAQLKTLRVLSHQIIALLELRRKVNEVELLSSELQLAYDELESFTYTVSHDLKAPLRSIDGYANIILEDYVDELNETCRDYFQNISRSSVRMNNLINDLLDLAKISRKPLRLGEVNLTEQCKAVLSKMDLDDKYDIEVEEGLLFCCDASLAKTVIENVIGNAIKYSSQERSPKIRIGKKQIEDKVYLYVQDNGPGFNLEYVQKIYKPFERLHNNEEFPGNGIGLAIVKNIVQKHGGEIWAESEIGEGSTFYFNFG